MEKKDARKVPTKSQIMPGRGFCDRMNRIQKIGASQAARGILQFPSTKNARNFRPITGIEYHLM
jgi:hypothetical protein